MTFSKSAVRRSFAWGAFLAVGSLSSAAFAQRSAQDIASARQLYNDGIELRDKGDMKGALEKFRAAHALGHTPLTGIELCRAHAAVRQPVEAREACLSVGRIAPMPEESARSKEARAEAERIAEAEKPKIGALRIRVSGVPAGQVPTVVVDGVGVPAAALNEPRAVNPGSHTVVANVSGGAETRASFEMLEGETREIELVVAPPLPPPESSPEPSPSHAASPEAPAVVTDRERPNTFAIVSFAIAGVSAVVGGVAGGLALSKEGDLEQECARKICGRDQWSELDSARAWGNASTALFVVSGAALGAGIVSVLASGWTKKSPRASRGAVTPSAAIEVVPVFGPGGGGIRASF